MIDSCAFEQFNLKFIDFDSLFKVIEVDLINDLATYNLIPAKKVTRDIKKLFYHHIFYGVSEYLLNTKSKERAIILKSLNFNLKDFTISQYFKGDDVQRHIEQAVRQVAKLLPINIYGYSNIIFRDLKKSYEIRNGDVVELVERIRSFMWTRDFMRSHYTFSKVKSFVKRNELKFLDEKYFNQLKTKQLLFI